MADVVPTEKERGEAVGRDGLSTISRGRRSKRESSKGYQKSWGAGCACCLIMLRCCVEQRREEKTRRGRTEGRSKNAQSERLSPIIPGFRIYWEVSMLRYWSNTCRFGILWTTLIYSKMWQTRIFGSYPPLGSILQSWPMKVCFMGATHFGPWERIWKTWAPPKCRFFMWIVAHKRCWTADQLARHGLPHQERCLLCDQEEESVDHLLVGCVFACQF